MNKNNLLALLTSFISFAVIAGLAFVGFFTALFLIPIVVVVGAFFIWRTKRKMKNMYMDENSSFIYVRNLNDLNPDNSDKHENIIEISDKDYTIVDAELTHKSDK